MKIAVLTDAHANLPALRAALDAIRREGCDAVYHTGDAIAIGPQPAECLDTLLDIPNVHLLMGNHDAWFAHGLPDPQPSWMSDGEIVHQHWVHDQLDPSLRTVVARWPYVIREIWEGVRVTLLHYEPDTLSGGFVPTLRRPNAEDLDGLFAHRQADVVFYGHTHMAWDVEGRARYVNPGSLGCYREAVARFIVLECAESAFRLGKRAVPYDDMLLREAFERRKVPERQFIYGAFFGSRFGLDAEDGT